MVDPRSTEETLILVEDEQAILAISTRILQWMGYTVLTVSRPDKAIRLTDGRAGEIHLLVTDAVMPGMNGRGLARRLLTDNPKLKNLFMSGYTADIIQSYSVTRPLKFR